MIFLFTGTPGASKTLNAIKFVNEDKTFEGRPVYYFNVKQLNLPWEEMTEEQAKKWYELPHGSVIFFDEAYDLFPTRHGGKEVPEHIKQLAVHRHKGYDIIMVCQKVTGQLDSFIRGLVGRHIHLERKFGTKLVKWYEWQRCEENVNSLAARNNSVPKDVIIDKKYFGAYHSAEVHTVKSNFPWKYFVYIAVLGVLIAMLAMYLVSYFTKSQADPAELDPAKPAQYALTHSSGQPELSYFDKHEPRLKGFPHTAPIYDEIMEPKSAPKPAACYMWTTGKNSGICTCKTQQATPLDVPYDACLKIVKGGWFDPTIDEEQRRKDAQASRQQQEQQQQRISDDLPTHSKSPVHYVADTAPRHAISPREPRNVRRVRVPIETLGGNFTK